MGFHTSAMVNMAKGLTVNQEHFDHTKNMLIDSTESWCAKMEKEMEEAKKLLESNPLKISKLKKAKEYAVATDNLLPLANLHGWLKNVKEDLGTLTEIPAV